ncbi:hypothetical protein DdX_06725 [Ditylenchus destructor]|uniref:Uncharacterized protein n=1 Tax=Ditylenchus destructor TaxID=166010 RepID=A0AAD4N9L5_9BILA|nr:hypothetical protein DdX_06725 [Ditylenchus destructor]
MFANIAWVSLTATVLLSMAVIEISAPGIVLDSCPKNYTLPWHNSSDPCGMAELAENEFNRDHRIDIKYGFNACNCKRCRMYYNLESCLNESGLYDKIVIDRHIQNARKMYWNLCGNHSPVALLNISFAIFCGAVILVISKVFHNY